MSPEETPDNVRVATYGILRGCGEAMKRSREYWYVDHAYFSRGTHYRVVHNRLWHDLTPKLDENWSKFVSSGKLLAKWRTKGQHVIVVPPSNYMKDYLGLEDWLSETLDTLRENTDRPITISEKGGIRLEDCIEEAWCLVTHHSNSAVEAMLRGIPSIVTGRGLGVVQDIENPPMDRSAFSYLANNEFTLDEIEKGLPWV